MEKSEVRSPVSSLPVGSSAAAASAASPAFEVPVRSTAPRGSAVQRTLPLTSLRLADRLPAARPVTLSGGNDGAVRELLLGPPAPPSAGPDAPPLRGAPFLCELDEVAFARVNERARRVVLDEGDRLLRQGDPADALLVVRDGRLVPILEGSPPKRLSALEPGAVAGELALFADEPAPATLEAESDVRVVVLDRSLAHEIVATDVHALAALLRALRERATERLLRASPLFAPLGADERARVATRLRFLEADPGATLVAPGRPAEAMFVLLAGVAEARGVDGGAPLRLGPADVFAEALLAGDEASPTSVVARSRCWLLALDRGELRALLAGRPHLGALAAELVDERHERAFGHGAPSLVDRRLALL